MSVGGHSELWDKLRLPYYDRAQAGEYMKRHLTYASTPQEIFTDKAINEIHRFSGGAARLVNKACTHCLVYGAQNVHRIINDHAVARIIQRELS